MSNIIPDKSLGQHWLTDESILEKIVGYADTSENDEVVEVGPGLGTLTRPLTEHAGHVTAIELDKELADSLEVRVGALNLSVEQKSVLDYNFGELPRDYKVVANIPYYLTAKLLRLLLESQNPPILSVLLVQKEVAQRLAAQPGEMSLLAVSAQYYAKVSLGIEVPAGYFTPPPKVDSQVIILDRREEVLFPDIKTEDYFRLVKAGFSQRRKKLRSSLSAGLHLSKTDIETTLQKADLSLNARPQELSLDDWARLVRLFVKE